jgi:phosphonate degradation associated HDIG domain protein
MKDGCGLTKMAGTPSAANEVLVLFAERGDSTYGGEAVSQRAHALQAAHFARRAGAGPAVIVAALLHDVGHLLHNLPDDAPDQGVDDRHEDLAARWLAHRFGPDVVEPARLHVAAKRYLCAVEPGYYDALSAPSKVSLHLQGGPMSAEETEQFRASPHAESAVILRRCDDAAKVPELVVPELEEYVPWIERVAIEP